MENSRSSFHVQYPAWVFRGTQNLQCNHIPTLKVLTVAQADQNGALNRSGIKAPFAERAVPETMLKLNPELFSIPLPGARTGDNFTKL